MIYLDNAATTKLSKIAKEAMEPYLDKYYGNPSSSYEFGEISKKIMDEGREQISKIINCNPGEIYYTSGGTESDNFAIKQIAECYGGGHGHIITSKIEHHAILHSCKSIEKKGYEVSYIGVDKWGRVNINELINAIRSDTILISIMHANNEIGTVQPIAAIGRIARENGIIFHTDAVQSFAHIPIDVELMNIDLLSASGHKFNGPKGIGFMYVRDGIKVTPLLDGGEQEKGLRAGTGNVASVAGMSAVAKEAEKRMYERINYESKLRDYFVKRVLREIPYVKYNGNVKNKLPNNANLTVKGVSGSVLMVMLDEAGICVSTGSACNSNSKEPSHVLKAIGLSDKDAECTIRVTLSSDNTYKEIDYTVDKMKKIVYEVREKLA